MISEALQVALNIKCQDALVFYNQNLHFLHLASPTDSNENIYSDSFPAWRLRFAIFELSKT